ncbi:DUF4429 domain-containing protein [Isoptericola sp. NPDC056134]|uniref:DUF4429 domain-containing protein n=1 Tax=Isoptericola sp. NPDC056134 TaxID=3345723 RepID=UPI0035E64FF8
MKANGYGADLEFDGEHVIIYPGKMQARMVGTQRIAVPLADVIDVEYKPAKALTNGQIRFKVEAASDSQTMQDYGGRGPIPTEDAAAARAYAKQGLVTSEALVVHWRKKDQDAFEALHQEITAAR